MGKKINKNGGKRRKSRRVTIRKIKPITERSPAIEFEFNIGFQGIKIKRELLEIKSIVISKKVLDKLLDKPGHLTIEEIKFVLESPNGIYLKEGNEIWFFSQNEKVTKKVVVKLVKKGTKHWISTAHIMSTDRFNHDVKKKRLKLIWTNFES